MAKEKTHIQFRGSMLDFVKFQAQHSVPFHLNDGEVTLVAYMFLYGDKAVERFIADGHSRSEKSVENYMSTLRKKGLVTGKVLIPELYLSTEHVDHVFTFSVDTV